VRSDEELWRNRGISAVPSIVFNQRWMIQGGQPPEVFEKAIRQILAQSAAA
jgi:predicted DsbA family dithiol-disulfide isomerase